MRKLRLRRGQICSCWASQPVSKAQAQVWSPGIQSKTHPGQWDIGTNGSDKGINWEPFKKAIFPLYVLYYLYYFICSYSIGSFKDITLNPFGMSNKFKKNI